MSDDSVNVLVTGADGFIGSHLTEALLARGMNVTALSLYNSFDSHGWLDDLPEESRAKLRMVRGDIRDTAFVRRIMRDQSIVFHLAALIAIPQSYVAAQSYVETNVMGTLNVLEAARELGHPASCTPPRARSTARRSPCRLPRAIRFRANRLIRRRKSALT